MSGMKRKILSGIYIVILALYPLRNIWLGVELTDSAYSAGNYRFLEKMDPMWFFSTYLANVTGRFLTELPGGHLFMGLKFYTALFVSLIAVLSYMFFTKVMRYDRTLVFFGELLAISLCWCPTTILYNYMTYLFFNAGVMVLYLGLVKEKRILLFAAGILLGMNVFVRFPNLTEAALICALWYYGFLQRKRIKDVIQETGVCLLGYLAGAGGVLLQIASKYGWLAYQEGIIRLLQMPSEAPDYSAYSMVVELFYAYKNSVKWLVHMLLLTMIGCAAFGLAHKITKGKNIEKVVRIFGKALFLGSILVLFRWWHAVGMFNVKYYTHECMFHWVAVFLILSIFTGIYVLFSKQCSRNEKLFAAMALILIGVTPLGSNNYLYPNMNNMFFIFPFMLSYCLKFLKYSWQGDTAYLFPVRAMLISFLAATAMQCLLFGAVYIFRDGMKGEKRDTKIEKNVILKGMVTNAPLAEAIEGLTAYVEAEGLYDRSVILYGQMPALTYMLDMPPAISTSWAELRSYSYEVMAEEMEKVRKKMDAGERPLIILGSVPERYILGEELTETEISYYKLNEKWDMLYDFMIENGYERTYGNEMFYVYQ